MGENRKPPMMKAGSRAPERMPDEINAVVERVRSVAPEHLWRVARFLDELEHEDAIVSPQSRGESVAVTLTEKSVNHDDCAYLDELRLSDPSQAPSKARELSRHTRTPKLYEGLGLVDPVRTRRSQSRELSQLSRRKRKNTPRRAK